MIGLELVGVLVPRLNVIISSGLENESVSRLDTITRSGLASASVSKLDVTVNASIKPPRPIECYSI